MTDAQFNEIFRLPTRRQHNGQSDVVAVFEAIESLPQGPGDGWETPTPKTPANADTFDLPDLIDFN